MSVIPVAWRLPAVFLLCASVCGVAAGEERVVEYVLPDSAYVQRECGKVQTTLQWVSGDSQRSKKIDRIRAERLAAEVAELCARRARGAVSADVWFVDFSATYAEFADVVFPCTSGEHCLQHTVAIRQPLPADLASYSVFLFTDSALVSSARPDDIKAIHDAFKRFGVAIGQTSGAIWLAKKSDAVLPDVERSKAIADLLELNYDDGPYVVLSAQRPDLIDAKSSVLVIRLEDIGPERIINVLGVLEQDLRRGLKATDAALRFGQIWQRFRSMAGGGARVAFGDVTIDFIGDKK